MPPHDGERQVLEVIVRSPGSVLDDIVLQCPHLTWNQVFLTIDRLSREGELTLTPKGQGIYQVHLAGSGGQSGHHHASA